MRTNNKLRVGDVSGNGQITIIDEDRLCYLVKSVSKGAVGLRTISKALLDEFVAYMRQHPEVPANEVRFKISGQSDIDKYEYGYGATLSVMANMVLGRTEVHNNTIVEKEILRNNYAATFLKEAMHITLLKDNNLCRLSALKKFEKTSKRLKINGFTIGCDKKQLPQRTSDFYSEVSWEYDSDEYVLNLEFTPAAFEQMLFPVYNEAYFGLFKMEKDIDGDYVLYEISNIQKEEPLNAFSPDVNYFFRSYITAIKSKPFLLLAGISGTGKSRIVRELARACWEEGSEEFKAQKPKNFEMVQVKPNWHDSSELIGYVSRVSGSPVFVAGDFLKFVAKAWENPEVPYFLCLDEMNLAPVEQYFAEYLSVVESRKADENGVIATDPILKKCDEQWYFDLTAQLTNNDEVRARFNKDGISIPQNLIVVGTVNMDETTFSFSRKVLDRAMTIEMNEVDLYGGLNARHEKIGKLEAGNLIGTAVEGVDVYEENKDVCDTALKYLEAVNTQLEGTPFKVAYRTRNEFLLYVVNNLPYNKDKEGNEISQQEVIARALDEITNMKILSRIEGDETKVSASFLDGLENTIRTGLMAVCPNLFEEGDSKKAYVSVSLAKLTEMKKRLTSGYTSFWS